ncbi:MAG: type I methionyl aminopeptidase [Gemmatimonadota bacterium]|jgi:methionyl aminopeptidase
MIPLRTGTEIDAIARAGSILARLFQAIEPKIVAGVSTAELDRFAEEFIRSHDGAKPSFKGLYGFPATLCTSINEEVVHGIPGRKRKLREGDIVSLDAGVKLAGWCADHAVTFPVGSIDAPTRELLSVTRESLEAGIAMARPGNRVGDIGAAIQDVAESAGLSVVRELVGHGVGRLPHEKPEVPNFGRPGTGIRLMAGLVLAIEPMLNRGQREIETLPDEWTVVTADRQRSAHFEHTVAVTADGPRVLTVP